MLLFLDEHSSPDIANSTHALSKVNDDANLAVLFEMHCVIKYMLDITNFGLKLEPLCNKKEPWMIACFSESNFYGDHVRRRSLS